MLILERWAYFFFWPRVPNTFIQKPVSASRQRVQYCIWIFVGCSSSFFMSRLTLVSITRAELVNGEWNTSVVKLIIGGLDGALLTTNLDKTRVRAERHRRFVPAVSLVPAELPHCRFVGHDPERADTRAEHVVIERHAQRPATPDGRPYENRIVAFSSSGSFQVEVVPCDKNRCRMWAPVNNKGTTSRFDVTTCELDDRTTGNCRTAMYFYELLSS